jgi:hypothetical protein
MTVREWLLENWESFDNRPECISAGSEETDKSKRTIRKVLKQLEDAGIVNWGKEKGDIQEKKNFQMSPDNKLAHLDLVASVPHTVEDLMNIAELPREKWEIARQRLNFWGNSENPSWQVRAEFIRKVSEGCEEFLSQVADSMKDFIPKYPKLEYKKEVGSYLLDASLYDAHLGLVSNEYNLDVGLSRFYEAVTRILNWYRPYPVTQIVFPVGNDIFNSNDSQGRTVKGNYRDDDPRWKNTFRRTFETVVKSIDLCQTVAPVHIKIVGGNHDADKTFHLGFALEMWYRDCPQVTIDNSDDNIKFYRWKSVLLGYTHGDARSIKELPFIMATQSNPEDWAKSKHRVCNTGHDHHLKEHHFLAKPITTQHDIHGVIVKTSPALCGRSTWEAWKLYNGLKSAIGTLYSDSEGEISTFKFNV